MLEDIILTMVEPSHFLLVSIYRYATTIGDICNMCGQCQAADVALYTIYVFHEICIASMYTNNDVRLNLC